MEGQFCSVGIWAFIVSWGFVVSVVGGWVFTSVVVIGLRWWADGRSPYRYECPFEDKFFWITSIEGAIERIAITGIATYNLRAAGAFVIAWIGFKLLSGWNRQRRSMPHSRDEDQRDSRDDDWLVRRAHSALTGSLVSAGTAIVGAMMICGKVWS